MAERAAHIVASSFTFDAEGWDIPVKSAKGKIQRILETPSRRNSETININPQYISMGAALAGIVFCSDGVLAFTCVDCRVYVQQGEYLDKLTHDHSIVQELCGRYEITEEEMRTNPKKTLLPHAYYQISMIFTYFTVLFLYRRCSVDSLYFMDEAYFYLNVWKSDNASSENKLVMVWIHGGTSDPLYECSNFVRENPDVIAVSIKYRVSIFGLFHLSHLHDGKDYPDAQNLGLMNQIMALKCVHENIAAFGGDPENVTIFGEYAGGASVTTLPLIAGSHKYFHCVISQSGSPVFTRYTKRSIARTNKRKISTAGFIRGLY